MFLASLELYMAWRRKNPKISLGAFDAKDRRIRYGYIGMIPLPEPLILDILMGKKDEKEITPEDILAYDEPGEYTLPANSSMIHPEASQLSRHETNLSRASSWWRESSQASPGNPTKRHEGEPQRRS